MRSDGTGTPEEIAVAAARDGLQFVIMTDHGDATRAPEPPRYVSGVLVIDAVEVSTDRGHLVVLGGRPSPFPLAGEPSAVLEDAHRLGGMGIAAHPGSPRASLQWSDWDVPIDGLEWLNADSEWRDELFASLGRLMLTYWLRPAETLTASLDRPTSVLARWDALTSTRRVVGIAGSDAHARLGFRQQTEPYRKAGTCRCRRISRRFRHSASGFSSMRRFPETRRVTLGNCSIASGGGASSPSSTAWPRLGTSSSPRPAAVTRFEWAITSTSAEK